VSFATYNTLRMEFDEERFKGILLLHLACTLCVGIIGFVTFGHSDVRFGIFLEGLMCASALVFAGLYAMYYYLCYTSAETEEGEEYQYTEIQEPGSNRHAT